MRKRRFRFQGILSTLPLCRQGKGWAAQVQVSRRNMGRSILWMGGGSGFGTLRAISEP
jgi:hypothetical protein